MSFEKYLVIDDDPLIRTTLQIVLHRRRGAVALAASLGEARTILAKDTFDLVLMDVHLPDGDSISLLSEIRAQPDPPFVIMVTGGGTLESAVSYIRAGAFDYLLKPFSEGQLDLAIRQAEEFRRLSAFKNAVGGRDASQPAMIGESPPMVALRGLISRVGPTDATVLVHGESGTGKELAAAAVHEASARRTGPFLRVNCAAIAPTLMESEFFGHEKGSFTGATARREGRFELAHGGTILLDEISEIPPQLQAKLLRVLQEREFERVGGSRTIKVDVRVVATTNRDLVKTVAEGGFREDLYYRLNVFPLQMPPLRDRGGDVVLLAKDFLVRAARAHGRRGVTLGEPARMALLLHRWPGNVRELRNVVERAVILVSDGAEVEPLHLGLPDPRGDQAKPATQPVSGPAVSLVRPLAELERLAILEALIQASGSRGRAAAMLEISPRTLRHKLAQYRAEGHAIPEPERPEADGEGD